MTRTNHQWRLAARPEGMLKTSDFTWTEETLPELEDGQVLIKNQYLSLDPANRGWVNEARSYVDPVNIGDVMRGIAVGTVEESKNENFNQGDLVTGMINWQEYVITDGKGFQVLPPLPIPPTAWLAVLGMIGATAYFGLLDITDPKEGETLVVSGAAGAVGSIVGQIGKIKGCRVVGIAGSEEKCNWITNELGFDAAINYKTQDVQTALKETCPDGIDIYFDNVGGDILDAVLTRINNFGRISICGLISQYNATEPVPGPYNFVNILARRVKVQGFIVLDYYDRIKEAVTELGQWMMQGKIQHRVDVVEGLKEAPTAINKLFDGSNKGKLIIKV